MNDSIIIYECWIQHIFKSVLNKTCNRMRCNKFIIRNISSFFFSIWCRCLNAILTVVTKSKTVLFRPDPSGKLSRLSHPGLGELSRSELSGFGWVVPVRAVLVWTVPVWAVAVWAVPIWAVPIWAVPIWAVPVWAVLVRAAPVWDSRMNCPNRHLMGR